jgi:chromosome segregation ATPase
MPESVKKAVAEALGVFYHDLLEPRFDRIEAKLAEHDEKFNDILGHFDQLYQRLTRLEDEYQAIVQGLRRIESLLLGEQTKRELLEQRLEELKLQVGELQLKITDLEQRIQG